MRELQAILKILSLPLGKKDYYSTTLTLLQLIQYLEENDVLTISLPFGGFYCFPYIGFHW